MTSKKKLVISLSVAAAVLVAAIIAIVAVFAAASQTLTSSIKVTYTAGKNVAGTASASYKLSGEGATSVDMDTNGSTENGDKVITFNAIGEKQTQSLLTQGDISLDSDNVYVEFTYVFTNTGAYDYTAQISLLDKDATPASEAKVENLKVEYQAGVDGTYLENANALTVEAGDEEATFIYKVRISIANDAKDAAFEGVFSWDLEAQDPTV